MVDNFFRAEFKNIFPKVNLHKLRAQQAAEVKEKEELGASRVNDVQARTMTVRKLKNKEKRLKELSDRQYREASSESYGFSGYAAKK